MPSWVLERLTALAKEDGLSVNDEILCMVSEKLGEIKAEERFNKNNNERVS